MVRSTCASPTWNVRLEQFTYEYTSGNFINFTRRRLDLGLTGPLLMAFPGGQVTPAGTSAVSLTGLAKAQILSTQVADAARYYGIGKLAEAVSNGAAACACKACIPNWCPAPPRNRH